MSRWLPLTLRNASGLAAKQLSLWRRQRTLPSRCRENTRRNVLPSPRGKRTCPVSFCDSSGIRHSAEVTAETLYEAAVLGIKAISEHWAEEPGIGTRLEIEVKTPAVRHEITLRQLRQWLDGTCASPKEKLVKERLKALLA